MRNKFNTPFISLSLILHCCIPAFADTQYYRLSYRDDPSTTIVISWCDNGSSTNAMVYYGTTDFGTNYQSYPLNNGVDRTETNFKGLNHRFARLSALTPNTIYYFVIKDDNSASARMIFETLPDSSDVPITFITGGDSRTGFYTEFEYAQCRPRRQDANKLVAKIRPAFVAFSGDFVYSLPPLINSTDADWADWLTDWQLTITPDGQLIPLIPTLGNHEEALDVYNVLDVPNTNTYYSLAIGGNLLRLYTLNTEINCDTAQQNWLANDLQLHTGNSYEPYWKFVQYHYPFVPHAYYTPNTTMINCWASLFENYKVRLISEGHAHIIKVTWPIVLSSGAGSDNGFIRNDSIGIVYIGEGSWGAPLRDLYTYYNADAAYNWTRNQEKIPGFHVVCATKDTMEVRTVKIENVNNVGQNQSGDPPCTFPANIVLWAPSNGSLITLTNPIADTISSITRTKSKIASFSPNPARNVFRFELFEKDAEMQVFNALGRHIITVPVITGTEYILDLSHESPGVYFVYFRKDNIGETFKVTLSK
ncbi:MAG: fibronectin type III domain-containing protein [Bacteroidetes bacterium]|nr:fibronectin type III domain-containing protein [Bacteroidota bacterium]